MASVIVYVDGFNLYYGALKKTPYNPCESFDKTSGFRLGSSTRTIVTAPN